ncbi:phage head spike fiber domain-containing protein [Aeromonas caviae]
MAGLWQRTGNVTVTNGSKTITGFGTKWKTGTLPIQKGHTFYGPDNAAYEVDTVVSDTEILLVDTYRGGTMANQPYRIDITRTSTISQFAADLASLVAKYRSWFDGMMTWLTGSGDVAILNPDTGANVTIPSWKKVASEGEGQTARAKVEADRAKTEADRALTEADRAAGIVALAALPMPDVWAPLSDSLRLITGYGRDVLVGSDVVARMVNFSRNSTATYVGKDGQLKTAAANEPRFEKEGLLVEGSSQNLIKTSSGKVWENGFAAGANIALIDNADKMTSGIIPKMLKVGNEGRYGIYLPFEQSAPVVVGGTYTLTIRMRRLDANLTAISIYNASNVVNSATIPQGEWGTRTITFTANATDCYMLTAVGQYEYVYLQLEALPFASSYIPTNGAAVTRAADIVTIPWAMNINPATVTVALNYDLLGVGQSSQRLIEYAAPAAPRYLMQVTPAGSFESYCGASPLTVSNPTIGPGSLAVASTSPTRHALRLTGKIIATATPTGPAGATSNVTIGAAAGGTAPMFGHVRNLRIWHRALTDDQLKAVA